jgi:hypothetical protein
MDHRFGLGANCMGAPMNAQLRRQRGRCGNPFCLVELGGEGMFNDKLLCAPCNKHKGTKSWQLWMVEEGERSIAKSEGTTVAARRKAEAARRAAAAREAEEAAARRRWASEQARRAAAKAAVARAARQEIADNAYAAKAKASGGGLNGLGAKEKLAKVKGYFRHVEEVVKEKAAAQKATGCMSQTLSITLDDDIWAMMPADIKKNGGGPFLSWIIHKLGTMVMELQLEVAKIELAAAMGSNQ